jgi:hypothetical protein
LQLSEHLFGQLVAPDAPAGGTALFVDANQPQQLPDNLIAVAPTECDGVGEGRIGLPG